MTIKMSLFNQSFYTSKETEIVGQVVGVGNQGHSPNAGYVIVRTVDANDIVGADVYTLPDRLFGSDLSETNQEFVDRVDPQAMIAINQVIAGAKDALYLPNEKHLHLLQTINGWPRDVAT